MNPQTQEIYTEVYSILNLLGENYIKKLPVSLFKMIQKEKKQDYHPQHSQEINLKHQKIRRESLAMIALFHLNYWCDSEEEKNKLTLLFKTNEEKYQAEIREKYNPDDLFKNRLVKIEETVSTNQVFMVECKESIFKNILNKIRNFFHRK